MRNPLFKVIYKLHTYLGVFIAFHFAIFSLTGLILLFEDEIQGHSEETSTLIAHQAQLYGKSLARVQSLYPAEEVLAMYPEESNPNVAYLRLAPSRSTRLREARKVKVNIQTGEELSPDADLGSGFFETVLELHRDLFLGSAGKLYVGLVGFLYVLMLLSGFIIYGRFMKGRRLGEIRKPPLPKMVDLHKFTGAVTFGWALIVGLSGCLLAFNGTLIKYFQFQSLQHLSQEYQGYSAASKSEAPLQEVLRSGLNSFPDSVVTYISFPDTEFGIPGHFLLLVNGTEGISQKISQLAVVAADSGALKEIIELPFYLKALLLSEPLHFGNYGGLFLKILWALFALGSLLVVLMGFLSFIGKRNSFLRKRWNKKAEFLNKAAKPGKWEFLPPYGIPGVLAILSISALVTALFVEGLLGRLATGVLLLPLLLFFFGRRIRV